jgi:hypothetical protein
VSVVREGARAVLAQRLSGPPAPDGVVHRSNAADPRGFLDEAGADVADWLWGGREAAGAVPPLGDPAAYDLTGVAGPLTLDQLHGTPAEASGLGGPGLDAYRRASADVIMRGGTASGVVYPLALCEIARAMRLRSLGGASAGAIAAAAGAAAELGRVRRDRARPRAGDDPGREPSAADPIPTDTTPTNTTPTNTTPTDTTPDRSAAPARFRQGYPGLSDVAAWLAEIDPPAASPVGAPAAPPAGGGAAAAPTDPPADRFRVAGLFQPSPATRPAFRLVVAVLRGRTGAALALVPFAAGVVPTVIAATAILLSVPAVWVASPAAVPRGPAGAAVVLALLAAVTAVVVGAALSGDPGRRAAGAGLALVGLAGAVAITVTLAGGGARAVTGLWVSTLGAWALVAVVVLAVLLLPLLRFAGRSGRHRYGFVAGADDPPAGGLGARLDALAGLPPGRPVTAWLERVLDDLAGQADGEVLRFGHLWLGDDYVPPERREPGAGLPDGLPAAWRDPDQRLVDLRLVTSEITQGLAYELPVVAGDGRQPAGDLLYRPDEWQGGAAGTGGRVVTDRVLRAMATGSPVVARVRDETGMVELRALPEPWDLPVVVAVRLSMALPVAFQAVPLYRPAPQRPATDEFGRPLAAADAGDGRAATAPVLVDRLWFSDGGLTSNFPVHFFDSPLPRWPTLGINLGTLSPDAPGQDVDLPADGTAGRRAVARSRPVGTGLRSFAAALFATSRNWRDTEVSLRPAFAGRIAEVRLGRGEGDLNLFMPAATVATVALRGVVAGARLRRRWRYDPIWHRHQWLRMRESAGSVSAVLRAGRDADDDPRYGRLLRDPRAEVARIYASQRLGDPVPSRPGPGEADEADAVADVWGAVAAAPPPPDSLPQPPHATTG